MPCVIGPDGDRDSMPVVVKEALAMEVPVVASDAVGLPELVRWQWGRLHRPGDREALACALEELLALDPAQRAAMGRAGRAFVSEHCHVDRETQRLMELITYPDAPARRAPCAAESSRHSTATSGGSSSSDVLRSHAPTRVMRGSPAILNNPSTSLRAGQQVHLDGLGSVDHGAELEDLQAPRVATHALCEDSEDADAPS
jgi:hypothetical protein